MNFNFSPIKFKASSDLFNKPDSYALNFPNEEPKGFLKARDGKVAFIEFIHEDTGLKEKESIGEQYTGPGIYFMDYPNKNDDIPFWIVLPKGKRLTVGETKLILKKVESILLNKEYTNSNFWEMGDSI